MKESKSRKKINVQFEIDIPRDLEKFLHRRREHTIKKEKRVKEWNRTHAIRKKKGWNGKMCVKYQKRSQDIKKTKKFVERETFDGGIWYRNTIK